MKAKLRASKGLGKCLDGSLPDTVQGASDGNADSSAAGLLRIKPCRRIPAIATSRAFCSCLDRFPHRLPQPLALVWNSFLVPLDQVLVFIKSHSAICMNECFNVPDGLQPSWQKKQKHDA
jgi:hypothetical protein